MKSSPPPSAPLLDLHGKTAYQAKPAVDAALRRASPGVYRLRLVHGCHGGSALRDMIWAEYAAHPKVKRLVAAGDGVTELVLRELV